VGIKDKKVRLATQPEAGYDMTAWLGELEEAK